MNSCLRLFSVLAAFAIGTSAFAASDDAPSKPVKIAVQSIRYGKDDMALQQFAAEQQARFLLGDAWNSASDAQRKEFNQLFQSLFARIAFPKIRDNFRNLASITYENPAVSGDEAKVKSTIVIEHPLKKQELKLQYVVSKDKSGWKVFDVAVLGDSMLAGIRDDQVRPLLKSSGMNALLDAMRKKNQELSKTGRK